MTEESIEEQTPQSDYSRPTVRNRRGMRTGYTTGSCAAAAAKAAALTLLSGTHDPGSAISEVTIRLPIGEDATLRVHRCEWVDDSRVLCSVIKDGGDDPDATHGAEICVTVSRDPERRGLSIVGGAGVGTVTRPGTGIEVGEPAVTRVPRRMMAEAVSDAALSAGLEPDAGFVVQVSVTDGEEIAEKTTNARLGVLGGISILGSTGVVQPFSTAAWRASVHLAVDVAAANGLDHVVLSTGTRSEEYSRRHLDLPDMAYVEAGIFSGPSLKRCAMRTHRPGYPRGHDWQVLKDGCRPLRNARRRQPGGHRFSGGTGRAVRGYAGGAGGDKGRKQRPAFPGDSAGQRPDGGHPDYLPDGLRREPQAAWR